MRNLVKNEYAIPDWLIQLSDNFVNYCIAYGFNQSVIDQMNGKYSCNSQIYHFATCFYDTVDDLTAKYG